MRAEPRIVFFGLEGVFSRTLLKALAAAGHAPELIVIGCPPSPLVRGPTVRRLKRTPGWLDRMLGRELAPNKGKLSAVAHELGIDVIETNDPGAVRVRADIRAAEPDVLVVGGFHRLLPESVLTLAAYGGLNVHPGRLPEERGPSPLFWALKAGRTELHWSIHILDAGEDTGDVVARDRFIVPPGQDYIEILERCAGAATTPLVRSLRSLVAGDLVRTPQNNAHAGRCPRPEFADGEINPRGSAKDAYIFAASCGRQFSLWVECANDRFFVEDATDYDLSRSLDYDFVLQGETLLLRCQPGVVELSLKPDGAIFSAEY